MLQRTDPSYIQYLDINNIKDSDEIFAAFCIGNGLVAPDHGQGIELYKKLGRAARLWTVYCHPYKMTAEEFAQEIKSSIDHFVANCNSPHAPGMDTPKFAEDWMEMYQAWAEMEKGDFTN